MAQGLFTVGFTLEDVLTIQRRAVALLQEGKTIMSWGSAGSSTSKQFVMPVDRVLEECQLALRVLAPEIYGFHVTRTVAGFS